MKNQNFSRRLVLLLSAAAVCSLCVGADSGGCDSAKAAWYFCGDSAAPTFACNLSADMTTYPNGIYPGTPQCGLLFCEPNQAAAVAAAQTLLGRPDPQVRCIYVGASTMAAAASNAFPAGVPCLSRAPAPTDAGGACVPLYDPASPAAACSPFAAPSNPSACCFPYTCEPLYPTTANRCCIDPTYDLVSMCAVDAQCCVGRCVSGIPGGCVCSLDGEGCQTDTDCCDWPNSACDLYGSCDSTNRPPQRPFM